MPSALILFLLLFSPPVEFMHNLNTYKGKDVLVTTLHTTVKVIFFAMYKCKYEKWLCIFEFSNLSDALYHSYSKE